MGLTQLRHLMGSILAPDENQWIDDLAAEIGDRINAAFKGRWPR